MGGAREGSPKPLRERGEKRTIVKAMTPMPKMEMIAFRVLDRKTSTSMMVMMRMCNL